MTTICPYCGKYLTCDVPDEPKPRQLRGEQAYKLRASGMAWSAVAVELGYTQPGGKGSAHTLAKDWAVRHGKPWPPVNTD